MCCPVREGPITVILIELIFAEVSDVEIYIAIIIVITDSCTDTVSRTSDTCLVGNIGESIIAIVSIENVTRCAVLFTTGLNCAIDEVDVEITVAIIIEKSTARSEEFVEESQTAAAIGMNKRYACGFRNINEDRCCDREGAILEANKCASEKAIGERDAIEVSFPHKEKFIALFVSSASNALSFVMPSEHRYRQVQFL